MADDDIEQSQKTEEPTQRRIDEAVKRGQVIFSREITNFLILLALAINMYWFFPDSMKDATKSLLYFIERPHDIDFASSDSRRFATMELLHAAGTIALPVIVMIFAVFMSSFLQNGFIFSWDPIMPDLNKISIMRGFKRIFSTRSVMEFVKGIIKIIIVGTISFIAIWPYLNNLENLPGFEVVSILSFVGHLSMRVMIGVCSAMALIAVLDYLYQRAEYLKSLRMTKQEVKEEMKQSEGDPIVKGKLKQIRMERARRRMIAAIPKADVVITNPTHFAVALEYDSKTMTAPLLTAKGADLLAAQIRKIAKEHNVPIVENPPLARILYEQVDIDQTIPVEHYQAVAEIIAYVYRLKNKKAA